MKTKIKHTNKDDIKKKMDHLQPEKMKMTPSKLKQPLKAELICQLKKLEDEKQLLQKENLEMGNTIKQLENKLAHLEEKTKTVEFESISTQTVRILSCHKCDYKIDDVYELDAHRWIEHEDDEPDTNIHTVEEGRVSENITTQFNCNFCSKTYSRKSDIMKHKKQEHEEKVATCWKFVAGDCRFSDKNCWFNHSENNLEDLDEIECNWCEKIFMTQPEFLNHRKREHMQYVPKCRNPEIGTCTYNKFCWFIHDQHEYDEKIEINEVFDRIGLMKKKMEEMTEKLTQIENNDL